MHTKPGYTLIEALVTIAIIGMLLGLLVPLVDRSLGKNRLANDVELLRSKIEEVRLLAGSTQSADEIEEASAEVTDDVGYYALYIPGDSRPNNFFAIVRLSEPIKLAGGSGSPPNYCSAAIAADQAVSGRGHCLVDKVLLSRSVVIADTDHPDRMVAFRVPTRQLFELERVGSDWGFTPQPVFDWTGHELRLTFSDKTATVSLEPYTARLKVVY
jgi:prepilin-type N-terminal cleavage/methylation domain-containing protein